MREQNEHFDAFEKEEVTICLCIITCQVRQAYLIQYALRLARGLAEVHRLVLEHWENVSVAYPRFSCHSPQPWMEMPCSAPPYTSPQAQNRAKAMWYAKRTCLQGKTVPFCEAQSFETGCRWRSQDIKRDWKLEHEEIKKLSERNYSEKFEKMKCHFRAKSFLESRLESIHWANSIKSEKKTNPKMVKRIENDWMFLHRG